MSNLGNSPLVTYKQLSPNYTGPRNHAIDTITPHCVVGHLSLQTLARIFSTPARQASCNYGIDDDGQIGLIVEEKNRSWCSSNPSNDHRAITIEIACDTTYPYAMTNGAIDGLIKLCVDVCQRNKIPKLLWQANKNLIGKVDQQNVTVHRWFNATACPGDFLYGRLDEVATEVNKILLPSPAPAPIPASGVPYKVKVTASTLYYRKGAGVNFPIVGLIRKDEIYTITEEAVGRGASKWGKLKSGVGWISLDYCVKVG